MNVNYNRKIKLENIRQKQQLKSNKYLKFDLNDT